MVKTRHVLTNKAGMADLTTSTYNQLNRKRDIRSAQHEFLVIVSQQYKSYKER